MNTRERTYAVLRKRVADRKEKRQALVSKLREDEYFDDLMRAANSLRWDCVLEKGEKQQKAKADLAETKQKIKEYLLSKGYTEEILSDAESCNFCHDTGVYEGRMCSCAEEIRQEIEEEESPLIKTVPDSLDAIDLNFYGVGKNTYGKYVSFLKKAVVDGPINFAVIGGKTGTGKTYLGCTATRECMKRGESVLAVSAIALNQKFLAYHCAHLENKQELWDELIEPDVLYIDDLGTEVLLNNVTVTYLYALLVERLEKKTIITTNLDVVRLEERYGERIISRLLDKRKGAMMSFEGEDLRF